MNQLKGKTIDDVKVIVFIEGEQYTIIPKQSVHPDDALHSRKSIFRLFMDSHELVPVTKKINSKN